MPVVLLADANTGQVLAERRSTHRFIPASVTKVMTLFLAFELMADGKLDPAQEITMRPETHEEWFRKGSSMFIEEGQAVPLDTILQGIAAVSANDGSVALAEAAGGSILGWTVMMNEKAREIGMTDSHFATPNGWPDGGKTFTSARDLEILAREMIRRHPDKYARYIGLNGLDFNGIAQANRDPITRRVEGADGIKTGYTRHAGHSFLGSAERDGTRLIMVVAGADDYLIRGDLSRQLIDWGFEGFDRMTLFPAGREVGTAQVQDGSLDTVGLVTMQPVRVAIPKGSTASPELSIQYRGPLRAPLADGSEVAQLVVTIEGMAPVSFPLTVETEVEKAGVFTRIRHGITSWFS
ncbi:D-alanyl-D-alanine carboxypeptidase family protein [Erythrobacter sp. HKB08]|uniref:D-alanyl-D-alanine carboxypeptidase family protein n=1 Tax=Erythrobacter sp. HKB08 TaxID=2502843 RepID=UPI001F2A85C1|nr:D-alanyl-D-alanine carboxypeptidase family protein [Erythrobacter sp. HKB08]